MAPFCASDTALVHNVPHPTGCIPHPALQG